MTMGLGDRRVKTDEKRIMVVEDNRLAATFLGDILEQAGYHVSKAASGLEALRLAQQGHIDLVLLDIMMPDMNGYEVVRQLRNDTRTNNTPIILLSSHQGTAEKVKGFELGADDYVTKPFVPAELLARVMAHLRRSRLTLSSSPLTGLPGNASIEDELMERVASDQLFTVLYVDIDNFKAFNDTYGFLQGDQMIRLLAETLQKVTSQYGNKGDLVGHIGGDDFVVVTTPEHADAVCQNAIAHFSAVSRQLYEAGCEDLLPVTLSIAAVSNEYRDFADHWEIGAEAATLKQQAKCVHGNAYVKSEPMLEHEHRGEKHILVVDDDRLVSALLQANFEQRGYNIVLVSSVLAAVHSMRIQKPDLIILDVVLPGTSGFAFCRRLKATQGTERIPVLMISSEDVREKALEAGANAFLTKPFDIVQMQALVLQLLSLDHLE